MSTFQERLTLASKKNSSLLCVGLDPDPALMPVADVLEFNRAIIDATADLVCCYKPNLAFYEALGIPGLEALQRTLEHIPSDIPVIGDAKRGDIGSTAQAYAKAMFEQWGFDAITANPYGGRDAVEPFLKYEDRGSLLWCRSSNPDAADFQDLSVAEGSERRPLHEKVALKAQEWNTRGNVGLVMGATYPEQLKIVRQLCPDMVILAPGVGAQEGVLGNTVRWGVNASAEGLIINSSRGIIFTSKDKDDYANEARRAAQELRQNINRARE
ncbi:MAG: orotidine-5'-phosphate decarboxylase [Dehalococcoidia bacterium]|jgi:orotidine-5'-phosphate decarboxylase|nr:orotidine-5'-phosphate decarboxylase [Dehalococcoidia bacterium]